MRINKFLATAGLGSRRKCEQFVLDGKVFVNGKVVSNLAFDVSEKDDVRIDGKRINGVKKFSYVMMHKPKGYLTTVSDDRDRKTVMQLLPDNCKNLKPVGRLDMNSEGLLLFTNDGDVAQKLTRPSQEIEKVYIVKVEGEVTKDDIMKMQSGVELVDGTKFKECEIKLLEIENRKSRLEVHLKEGKNREIRKIFDKFNYNVIFLKRVSVGEIRLGGLTRGTCRPLRSSEIEYLKSIK